MIGRLQAIGALAGVAVFASAATGWKIAGMVQSVRKDVRDAVTLELTARHNELIEAERAMAEQRVLNEREANARRFAAASNNARAQINRWKNAYDDALRNNADFAACDGVPMPRELLLCPKNAGCTGSGSDAGGDSE